MSHFIEKCICGNVLAQCRCMGEKTVHIKEPCICKQPMTPNTQYSNELRQKILDSSVTPEVANDSGYLFIHIDTLMPLIKQSNLALLERLEKQAQDMRGCDEYDQSTDSIRCQWCGQTEFHSEHDKARILAAIQSEKERIGGE